MKPNLYKCTKCDRTYDINKDAIYFKSVDNTIRCMICKEKLIKNIEVTEQQKKIYKEMTRAEEISIDSLAIMSARYSHTRNTGATYLVIQALKSYAWEQMSNRGKRQLIEETKESQYGKMEWEQFFKEIGIENE